MGGRFRMMEIYSRIFSEESRDTIAVILEKADRWRRM